jgi:antitoxin FitA
MVNVMATLTIKNFPDELYRELTQIAKKNRRSLNSEAIISVERGIERRQDETKPELLERIRDRREKMAEQGVWLTDDILRKAKTEGRL